MVKTALLSSTYFGPVQWYQKLHRFDCCLIERYDHFVKQTYRNRCVISTTFGLQTLSVPVERSEQPKCLMKDVRISDHDHWRHRHWNALMSAYGESPFFEFYADDLLPFFEKKWTFLFDFNLAITHKICELLDIHPNLRLTDAYADGLASPLARSSSDCSMLLDTDMDGKRGTEQRVNAADNPFHLIDYRDAIHPKHPSPDPDFVPQLYYQVFTQKPNFLPNLSILDLLFNEGNESIFFL